MTCLVEKEMAVKVERSWRLPFVSGHGFFVDMRLLKWCEQHKILIAIYAPHSAYMLQPLNVSDPLP